MQTVMDHRYLFLLLVIKILKPKVIKKQIWVLNLDSKKSTRHKNY